MAPKPEIRRLRGRNAALTRAVNNGERPSGDPELEEVRRELAAHRLAKYAEETVRDWPPLTDAQVDKIGWRGKPAEEFASLAISGRATPSVTVSRRRFRRRLFQVDTR